MIELVDCTYRIKKATLLNGVNLSVQAGEVVALLGPNGAGKSTLLKLATGTLLPTQGELYMANQPLPNWEPTALAKRRAVLSQTVALSAAFTVEEVVLMGRYPHHHGVAAQRDKTIAQAMMEKTGVAHLAHRSVNTLSGGERQRVHFARVLAQCEGDHPPVLFLDEPANNLDLPHQYHLLQVCRELAKQGGAVLVVLHDLSLAARFADRMVLLKEGKIVNQGTVTELLDPPLLKYVYGMPFHILYDEAGYPVVAPGVELKQPTLERTALAITH